MAYFKDLNEELQDFFGFAKDAYEGFDPQAQLARRADESDSEYEKRVSEAFRPLHTLKEYADAIRSNPFAPWYYATDNKLTRAWRLLFDELGKAEEHCKAAYVRAGSFCCNEGTLSDMCDLFDRVQEIIGAAEKAYKAAYRHVPYRLARI